MLGQPLRINTRLPLTAALVTTHRGDVRHTRPQPLLHAERGGDQGLLGVYNDRREGWSCTDELSRRLVRSEREAADEPDLVRVSRDGRIGPSPVASKAELAEHAARVTARRQPEPPRRFQVKRRNDNELILFVGTAARAGSSTRPARSTSSWSAHPRRPSWWSIIPGRRTARS